MRRLAARTIARDRGLRFEVIVGEEVTTRGGHLLALFIDEPIKPLPLAPLDDRRDPRSRRAGDPGPPARPVSRCAPRGSCCGAGSWPSPIRASIPTVSRRSTRRRSGGRATPAVARFAAETSLAAIGDSDAHAAEAIGTGWTTFPGRGPAELPPGDRGADHPRPWQLPRHGQPGLDVRPPAPQVRPRRPRRGPRSRPPGRDGSRPRLPGRAIAAAALRARARAERGRR